MLTIPLDEGARSVTEEEGLKAAVGRIRTAKRIVVVCGAGISTGSGIPDFRSSDGLFGKGKGKAKDLFHVRSLTSSTLLPEHHALLDELASLSNTAEPSAFHSYLSRLDGEGRLLRCYTQNIDGLEARAGLEVGLPSPAALVKSPRKKAAVSPTDSPMAPAPPAAPRCVPLHGQLTHLYCPLCSTSVPLSDHLPLPSDIIPCPSCDLDSSIRHALSERQRRTGHLRASVVLYGEEHPQGELIGTVVERDLRGSGRKGEKEGKVDLLLVVGTSLAIPGVKRMVKEFARSLAGRSGGGQGPRSIFVNRDPPKGSEWDGVFDTFVAGDIQDFVTRYIDDPAFITSSPAATTPRTPKKRKTITKEMFPPTPDTTPSNSTPSSTPAKKKRIVSLSSASEINRLQLPPTPRPTPPKKGALSSSNTRRQCGEEARSASPLTPISDLDENPFLLVHLPLVASARLLVTDWVMEYASLSPDELHLLYILLDSNLPTGGFVSSSGLEAYVKHGFLGIASASSPYDIEPHSTASTASASHGSAPTVLGPASSAGFTAVKGVRDVIRGVTDFAHAEVRHYASTTGSFVKDSWRAVSALRRADTDTDSDGAGKARGIEEVLADIARLDDYHEASMLSHVARRASKAQGVAMLTLFARGLTRPVGFDIDTQEEDGDDGARVVDAYKKMVRKGSVPGHLAVCWGVITAALGLSLDRSVHLYLFLHARSLLSTAVRMNIIGPYASSQMLLHPFKEIIERETARLGAEEVTTGLLRRKAGQQEEEEEVVGFWAWTQAAELGPATTWPLGETLMGRHDMQHSRIFNS